ncbi:uncharacterized protein LOC144136227 isoform X2 [Amblyomma americanum]|uniref:Uncharacterized protein n=1 Tax=Amblyomma americanum TaxID=6943 RepID=A0AAQ4D8K6_AMBAM
MSDVSVSSGLAFLLLLLLNTGTYQSGAFLWMHCIAFTYALNGMFLFMHGIIGDMELTRSFLATYFGSGGAMLVASSFLASPYTTHTSSTLLATVMIVLTLCLGLAMALLAIFVKKL